jgi:Family of unknown function (DUF5670)
MLTTLMVPFAAMWLLGVATSYTMGGFTHILLVATVAMLLVKMFRDRRPSAG